ncbi:MAG: epoxide hydrolase family protein [Vulcanimicrobiaceae bacterium]
MTAGSAVEPFKIAISDAQLADLAERLARTRWPDSVGEPWVYGTDLGYLRELVAYWRERFDWRAQEARLNAIPQVRVDAGGLNIHCLHVDGRGPAPLPLIVTHGWPGSIVEMLKILPLLTDPANHGGDAADAFDVVVPALPGYGFSDAAKRPGMNAGAIAERWVRLMSALGYERFGAQGGDWGAGVSTELGFGFPDRVIGVHLNYGMRAYLAPIDPRSDDERAYDEAVKRWAALEGGYAHIQGTKPQTVAYGLNDSPAGLAGYIIEKFRTWSDCGGDVESVFSRDDLLANVSLYWHTQSIGSSMRLYRERDVAPGRPAEPRSPVPFGFAAFPREISDPPRSLLERSFRLERYARMPRGGHFAAYEQPELLAAEIRAFFRPLR